MTILIKKQVALAASAKLGTYLTPNQKRVRDIFSTDLPASSWKSEAANFKHQCKIVWNGLKEIREKAVPPVKKWIEFKVELFEKLIKKSDLWTILGSLKPEGEYIEANKSLSPPESPPRKELDSHQWEYRLQRASSSESSEEADMDEPRTDIGEVKIGKKRYFMKLNEAVHNEQLATFVAYMMGVPELIARSILVTRHDGQVVQFQEGGQGNSFSSREKVYTDPFMRMTLFHLVIGAHDMHEENVLVTNSGYVTVDCKRTFPETASGVIFPDGNQGLSYNVCYFKEIWAADPLTPKQKKEAIHKLRNLVSALKPDQQGLLNGVPELADKIQGVLKRTEQLIQELSKESEVTLAHCVKACFPLTHQLVDELLALANPPADLFAELNLGLDLKGLKVYLETKYSVNLSI
jgi:hypothetical protein